MIVSHARNTIFLILNWPTHYDMTLSKCFPKMKTVKNIGFSAFHVENEETKMLTVAGRRVSRSPGFPTLKFVFCSKTCCKK